MSDKRTHEQRIAEMRGRIQNKRNSFEGAAAWTHEEIEYLLDRLEQTEAAVLAVRAKGESK